MLSDGNIAERLKVATSNQWRPLTTPLLLSALPSKGKIAEREGYYLSTGHKLAAGYNLLTGHRLETGYRLASGHSQEAGQNLATGHNLAICHSLATGHNLAQPSNC